MMLLSTVDDENNTFCVHDTIGTDLQNALTSRELLKPRDPKPTLERNSHSLIQYPQARALT